MTINLWKRTSLSWVFIQIDFATNIFSFLFYHLVTQFLNDKEGVILAIVPKSDLSSFSIITIIIYTEKWILILNMSQHSAEWFGSPHFTLQDNLAKSMWLVFPFHRWPIRDREIIVHTLFKVTKFEPFRVKIQSQFSHCVSSVATPTNIYYVLELFQALGTRERTKVWDPTA